MASITLKCTDGCTYYGDYVSENDNHVILRKVQFHLPNNKDFGEFHSVEFESSNMHNEAIRFLKRNIVWMTR